jgi:hypothetical protein
MRGTNLPISTFLELAIKAAEKIRYSGICLIIDRQAERQSRPSQQVADDRSSLHDITGKDVLIIVPPPESAPLEILHSLGPHSQPSSATNSDRWWAPTRKP